MKHCFKNSFWRYKSNFKFENISNKSTLYILSQNLLTFYTILCKRLVLFVYYISKLSHFLMQNLKLCKFGIATITIHQKWRSVCVDENEELSWRYRIRAQTTYTQIYLWFRLRKTAITLFCTLSLSLSHTHTHTHTCKTHTRCKWYKGSHRYIVVCVVLHVVPSQYTWLCVCIKCVCVWVCVCVCV